MPSQPFLSSDKHCIFENYFSATSEPNIHTCIKKIYPILNEFACLSRHKATIAIQTQQLRKRQRARNDEGSLRNRPKRTRATATSHENVIDFSDEDALDEYLDEDESEYNSE